MSDVILTIVLFAIVVGSGLVAFYCEWLSRNLIRHTNETRTILAIIYVAIVVLFFAPAFVPLIYPAGAQIAAAVGGVVMMVTTVEPLVKLLREELKARAAG